MIVSGSLVVPDKISLGGAATRSGSGRGGIPHITEERGLFTVSPNGSRSLEDAINFVDDVDVFRGNLVDYKVLSADRILVEHGGGLKIQYNVIPDSKFDDIFGNKLAAYGKNLQFYPDQRIGFNKMFSENPIVNIRQSVLSSDRATAATFNHEFFEIQGLYSKLRTQTMTPPQIQNLIDDLHVGAVNSSDRLVGRLIISEGL